MMVVVLIDFVKYRKYFNSLSAQGRSVCVCVCVCGAVANFQNSNPEIRCSLKDI